MKIKLPYFGECDDEQLGRLLVEIKVECDRLRNYHKALLKAEEPLCQLHTTEAEKMQCDLADAYIVNCDNAKSVVLKRLESFFNGIPLI